jgi:hypothetical protein
VPTFVALLRTPAAIDETVAGPFVQQLLQHPDDGEVIAQDGDAQEGTVRIAFEADDPADADLHARLLAERAPGCEVQGVEAL